ncbi:MAG: efflux RND transporter permease subunit [Hyphomicrobiaceae bacterium]
MRMNISAWAIRNPVPSLVLFMVLMTLGITTFRSMPVKRFPNIDIPVVTVQITQPGASPVELETQVTKKVENAVAGITGVKHILSNVVEGATTTTLEFDLGIPIDRATNDVKDAVDRLRSELPSTIDDPVVQRLDIAGLPILTYSARAPTMTPTELSWLVDDTIIRTLQGVKGIAQVARIGGVDREVRIDLAPEKLLALGITAGEVNRQLRATNVDIAGGRAEMSGRRQAIRTLAGKTTLKALGETKIALPGGRNVRLNELGTVKDTWEEPQFFADLDGKPAVAFSITRSKGASEITVAAAVEEAIEGLRKAHPAVELSRIDDTVSYTRGVYESTMKTLIEGAILAVFVVFIFLRDMRATVIAAIALPLSVIPTFWAMSAFGFSLNLVSLLAITIVTGILVDDAIVEIENIVRHIKMGKSPYRASLEAADEIGLAVIAITTTIIAVFVPVSFMDGIAGQYFRQFGLTVAAAVFFSLLVARLITPLLAAYFMRDIPHNDHEGALLRTYTRLVAWSVRHRIITVIFGLFVFAGSIASMYLIPSGFLPPEDTGRMFIALELPPGSTLADTRKVSRRIARDLKAREDVEKVFVDGGRILGSGSEVRKATLLVTLQPKAERALSLGEVKTEFIKLLNPVPDIRFWFFEENGQRLFQMVVTGRDGEAVNREAAKITREMRGLSELVLPNSTAGLERPELRVVPKTEIAAELGVTTSAIADVVRIATIGDVGPALARFSERDRQIPIRVQLTRQARSELDLLKTLKVRTASGKMVPLAAVADFQLAQGPTAIDRFDRQRQVTLGADLASGVALGDAVKAVENLPSAKALSDGLRLKQFGDAEVMAEVFENFGKAMSAGLMMVFAVLVLLFASFLQPITILFSLPLSIGGAIVALAITQNAISLPVVIGILMLMGVVTKNAIMLVDFANEEIARGIERSAAIVDAGRKRSRPIIMTTIAMCGGMLPSALALDSGGEFRAPMAIAVIGGLISSTVLTLVFVPAVYVLMDDIGQWLWRVFSRFIGPKDEPTVDPAE